VWLEEGEVERMAEHMRASAESFARRFVRDVVDPRDGTRRQALRETADEGGRCALLVGRNTCSVYDARPEHCRTFPYWNSVLTDRVAFENARSTCPGIAVQVEARVQEPAFADLADLYARLGCTEPDACCLGEQPSAVTYATALEADYALAAEPAITGACRLGDRRPHACRIPADGDGESTLRAVRSIERAHDYPAAYAPLADLLHARRALEDRP
jgi:Fe-S-cluster containining protein